MCLVEILLRWNNFSNICKDSACQLGSLQLQSPTLYQQSENTLKTYGCWRMRVWAIWSSYVFFACLDWFVKGLRSVSEGLLNKTKPEISAKRWKFWGPLWHLCLNLWHKMRVLTKCVTVCCWKGSERALMVFWLWCPSEVTSLQDLPVRACHRWGVAVLAQPWLCWHGQGFKAGIWGGQSGSSACCLSSSSALEVYGM